MTVDTLGLYRPRPRAQRVISIRPPAALSGLYEETLMTRQSHRIQLHLGLPRAGRNLPAPQAGRNLPAPYAGNRLPAPTAGNRIPAPVAGGKFPAPVA